MDGSENCRGHKWVSLPEEDFSKTIPSNCVEIIYRVTELIHYTQMHSISLTCTHAHFGTFVQLFDVKKKESFIEHHYKGISFESISIVTISIVPVSNVTTNWQHGQTIFKSQDRSTHGRE